MFRIGRLDWYRVQFRQHTLSGGILYGQTQPHMVLIWMFFLLLNVGHYSFGDSFGVICHHPWLAYTVISLELFLDPKVSPQGHVHTTLPTYSDFSR